MLRPLKTRIVMTAKLINQIVYKLYRLNDDEVAIAAGKRVLSKQLRSRNGLAQLPA